MARLLNQDIICIIKHNKKAGKSATGRGWKCWEKKQALLVVGWWLSAWGPSQEEMYSYSPCNSGSNDVASPQGRDERGVDRLNPS